MKNNTDQSSISDLHDDGQLRGKGRVQILPSPERRAQLLPLCSQKLQREVEICQQHDPYMVCIMCKDHIGSGPGGSEPGDIWMQGKDGRIGVLT